MEYWQIKALPSRKEKGASVYETPEGAVTIAGSARVADDAELWGGAEILGCSTVDKYSVVGGTVQDSDLRASRIGRGSKVVRSSLSGAECGDDCILEGVRIEEGVQIGNRAHAAGLVVECAAIIGNDLRAESGSRIRTRAWVGNGVTLEEGAEIGIKMRVLDRVRILSGAPCWNDTTLFAGEILTETGAIVPGN